MSDEIKGIDLTNGIRVMIGGNTIVLQGDDRARVRNKASLRNEVSKKLGRPANGLDYHVTPGGEVYVASEEQHPRVWAEIDREEAERIRKERQPE